MLSAVPGVEDDLRTEGQSRRGAREQRRDLANAMARAGFGITCQLARFA
jgi:hypothetical protein